MGKRSQIAICIGLICLLLGYMLMVRELGVKAVDRQLMTDEDTPVTVQLAPEGEEEDKYHIVIVEYPSSGAITKKGNHHIYLPGKDFNGKDKFTYLLKAGGRESAKGVVEIDVKPENDKPKLDNYTFETQEDQEIEIIVQANDIDNDVLTYQLLSQPKHGVILGELPNVRYKPAENYFGNDRFRMQASDGLLTSDPATVDIPVKPVNDPPQAIGKRVAVVENTLVVFTLQANDPENDKVTFEITASPEKGAITAKEDGETYVYSPDKGFVGSDFLLFKARDDELESDLTTVQFNVTKITGDSDLANVLNAVVKNGGVAIGDDQKPEHVFHSGRYIPASILKIATAAAALHYLGPNYRFKTEVFVDAGYNLYIKGFGDPGMTSKEWHEIARVLQKKNVFESDLNALIIDSTVFTDRLDVDGRRASTHYYDAPPSALPSNYNTVSLRIGHNRSIVLKDDYTPLTPMVIKKARQLPPGYQHFNVALNSEESICYSGELISAIFRDYGAFFEDIVYGGRVPDGLKPVYVFTSETTLNTMIKQMLRDSNNFIANQLVLTMAYETKGEGVGIADGAQIIAAFLQTRIGLGQDDFSLVEGSGLSTKNSIDLLAMLKIINYFKRYRELLPHLRLSRYPDLARSGRRWNILAKSGTLSNTSTLAGFIQVAKDEWKPFVIMLNDDGRERGKIMEIIGRYYNG